MIADFDGDGRAIGDGHVGGIGDDEFELLADDGRKQIALQETNAISHTHSGAAFSRATVESGFGNVNCGDCCLGPFVRESNRQLPRSPCRRRRCAGLETLARVRSTFSTRCSVSGRGTSTSERDAEGQSVEFAFARDVLDWLAFA